MSLQELIAKRKRFRADQQRAEDIIIRADTLARENVSSFPPMDPQGPDPDEYGPMMSDDRLEVSVLWLAALINTEHQRGVESVYTLLDDLIKYWDNSTNRVSIEDNHPDLKEIIAGIMDAL